MMRFLRSLIRPAWRRPYHLALAWLAAWRYGFPSRKLIVIGITGTDGKTTTATMTAAALEAGENGVGLSSTVWFQVGKKKWLNESHMTMPGRTQLQRLLRQMVDAGCHYAVLEVSSEGIAQGRLAGIDVDIAVLTNLTPEHIKSHGSFEKYQAAKRKLFTAVGLSKKKFLFGRDVPKVIIVNGDDEHAEAFLDIKADERVVTSIKTAPPIFKTSVPVTVHQAKNIISGETSSSFDLDGTSFEIHLPGLYNVSNAVEAIAAARAAGVPAERIKQGITNLKGVPGRFEVIDAKHGRQVVIDYAVTPAALRQLYTSLRQRGAKHIIAVFGAAGGGRDSWKRPELGKIADELADHIILTSEDPFNESPAKIATEIQAGISHADKVDVELDRRLAIQHALRLAKEGDVIALTGMGSETTMNVAGGKRVPWNDRDVVEDLVRA